MAKRGRPKIELDYSRIKVLAERHCTQEEIALDAGVSVKTLQRDKEFCRIYDENKNRAKIALRNKQWEVAMQGNAAMLRLLGKEILGQMDQAELKFPGELKINIIDNVKRKQKEG